MHSVPTIVILAAGSSSRLGHPKQLVPYKEQTLLAYTIEQAQAAGLGEVLVVLGAKAELLQKEVDELPILINDNWADGMGSSIAVAATYLINQSADAAIFLLCDQPFVTASLIKEAAAAGAQTGIAVCDYGVGKGPPSYFSSKYFEALLELKGDEGAKQLITKHADQVRYISFPLGRHDVDTIEDLKILEQ